MENIQLSLFGKTSSELSTQMGGEDFAIVLSKLVRGEILLPANKKWSRAGVAIGPLGQVAWRTFDAQFWGVPQRRRRIFLVTDFRGERAGEILFEFEGMHWNSQESREPREEVAAGVGDGTEATSGCLTPWDGQGNRVVATDGICPSLRSGNRQGYPMFNILAANGLPKTVGCLTAEGGDSKGAHGHKGLCTNQAVSAGHIIPVLSDQGGSRMDIGEGVCPTLRAQTHNHEPIVAQPTYAIQSATMPSKSQNGIGVSEGPMYTLDTRADHAVAQPIAFGPNGSKEISHCLCAKKSTGRLDPTNETMVAEPIAFNGRQDPVSGKVAGALDTSHYQTQCVAYPDPANTLLAKANMSFRGDTDNIILQIGDEENADAEERNTREILFKLWQEIGTETLSKWGLRVLEQLQQEAILRQELHERSVSEEAESGNYKLENQPHKVAECDFSRDMSGMWKETREGCSPQGWRLHEQQSVEPDSIMQGLPQLKAQAEAVLHNMWKTGEGVRILQQTLYSIQEVRRPELHKIQYRVRRLTPVETLRLMGFPDLWLDIEGASDSAKYKAIGNSIAIPPLDFIFKRIVEVTGNKFGR